MRIRKYDFDYGRRELMKKVAVGAGAGVGLATGMDSSVR